MGLTSAPYTENIFFRKKVRQIKSGALFKLTLLPLRTSGNTVHYPDTSMGLTSAPYTENIFFRKKVRQIKSGALFKLTLLPLRTSGNILPVPQSF